MKGMARAILLTIIGVEVLVVCAPACLAARATGPLRVSEVNPRYFGDGSGGVIYLTGAHSWADFQDMWTETEGSPSIWATAAARAPEATSMRAASRERGSRSSVV